MSFVIDASIAVCWCFEDEASPKTDALLERVAREGALVPALWHFELGNVLVQAERRKRLTSTDVTTRLELIGGLPITTDHESVGRAWREVITLARGHRLTTYDAAYLELAVRRGIPLATKDKELIAAARSIGMEVLP